MKRKIKKILTKIRRFFSKKYTVPFPVLYGDYLKNRTALITGGGTGIGYAIAESFVRNGANVIICGRNKENLKTATNRLKKILSDNQFVSYDILDISDVKNITNRLDSILEENKCKVDILVNNAGVGIGYSIGYTSIDDFEKLMNINLEGTYFVSQYFYNYMKNNNIKGNILNVASSSSLRPGTNPYTLSKWALLGLTKGLAKKGIEFGIVVNGIAPGPTATDMLHKKNTDDVNAPYVPAGRYIMPEEIANLSTILVSDLGKMIIGTTLFVTGGCATITYDDIEY